jgi:hypothetical protein
MSGRTARRGLVDALTGLAFVIALFAVLGYTYGAPSQHRRYGWQALAARPDRFGLVSLNGTIVAPRPNRPWRPGR